MDGNIGVARGFFSEIHNFTDDPKQILGLSGTASDELVVVALLAPLAGTNLGALVRCGMSISDASEEGAGSAIAESFVPQLY